MAQTTLALLADALLKDINAQAPADITGAPTGCGS
jgi:hypothetical protein